jgi:hypothetical protein
MPRKWLRQQGAGCDKSSAAERTNFPSEAVEMALAHAVGGTRWKRAREAIYSISGVA